MTPLRLLLLLGLVLAGFALPVSKAKAACSPIAFCSCTVSASSVAFGAYNTLTSAPTDSTGQVDVTCTMLVSLTGSYEVRLSAGQSGTPAARVMRSGASQLAYNLFVNASRSQVWGDGSQGSQTVAQGLQAIGYSRHTLTVYGRIPARQNVSAGTYSDAVTVTIFY